MAGLRDANPPQGPHLSSAMYIGQNMLLRRSSKYNRIPSCSDTLQEAECDNTRGHRTHEELTVGPGASPHGRSQAAQAGHSGEVGEHGKACTGGGAGEAIYGLRGRVETRMFWTREG